jgi:hypothetical protein
MYFSLAHVCWSSTKCRSRIPISIGVMLIGSTRYLIRIPPSTRWHGCILRTSALGLSLFVGIRRSSAQPSGRRARQSIPPSLAPDQVAGEPVNFYSMEAFHAIRAAHARRIAADSGCVSSMAEWHGRASRTQKAPTSDRFLVSSDDRDEKLARLATLVRFYRFGAKAQCGSAKEM